MIIDEDFENVLEIVKFVGRRLYKNVELNEIEYNVIRDFAETYFDNVLFADEYSSCLDGVGGIVTVMYLWNNNSKKIYKICLYCLGINRHYYP